MDQSSVKLIREILRAGGIRCQGAALEEMLLADPSVMLVIHAEVPMGQIYERTVLWHGSRLAASDTLGETFGVNDSIAS